MPDITPPTPVTPVKWTPSHTVMVIASAVSLGVIAALSALKNDPTYGPWVQPILLVLVPLLTALGIYSGKGLGNPNPPTGAAILMLCGGLGLATIVVGETGCPQGAPAIDPAIDCASTVIQDAVAGMTIQQIVAAVATPGSKCQLDAEKIVAILFGAKDPAVRTTAAYREAAVRLDAGSPVTP